MWEVRVLSQMYIHVLVLLATIKEAYSCLGCNLMLTRVNWRGRWGMNVRIWGGGGGGGGGGGEVVLIR